MDLHLTNHVCVVTGGASGIGLAIAKGLLAEGCRVAIWDAAANVEKVAAELASTSSPSVGGMRVDVASFSAVVSATQTTEVQLGPIDHVVHAAAISSGKFGFPFTNLTP